MADDEDEGPEPTAEPQGSTSFTDTGHSPITEERRPSATTIDTPQLTNLEIEESFITEVEETEEMVEEEPAHNAEPQQCEDKNDINQLDERKVDDNGCWTPEIAEAGDGVSMDQSQQNDAVPEEGTDENLIVLGPDHPRMQRFQKALKEHLQRQIEKTDSETRNKENELRRQKKRREELGNYLYNLQFELQRQNDQLEKFERDHQALERARLEMEERAEAIQQEFGDIKAKLATEVQNEKKIMKSVKEIDVMEWCVRQAVKEYDGELKTRQMIDEKYEKQKQKIEAEKLGQDFYLDRVMSHILQMEQAHLAIQRQIQAHQEEQKELQSFINEAEMEIESLDIEKKQLLKAWNESLTVVRCRDEALTAAVKTLTDTKELLKTRESELRALQREIRKEQEAHERSTAMLKRRKIEEQSLMCQMNQVCCGNEALKCNLAMLHNVQKCLSEELARSNFTLQSKQKEFNGPKRRMENIRRKRDALEYEIIKAFQEQVTLGKAAENVTVKVEAAKQKTRKLESESAKIENEISKLNVQIERSKDELLNKQILLKELESEVKEQEKGIAQYAIDVKEAEHAVQRKTAEIVRLNHKIDKLASASGTGKEQTVLEKEMEELETNIAREKDLCRELQSTWMKQQDELAALTSKRDNVLRENDLKRKETFILERKRSRLDQELQQKQKQVKKFNKELKDIRYQISVANSRLDQERNQHNRIDKDNVLLEHEFVGLIKDAESEALDLQAEIKRLDDAKDCLSNTLNEMHEQCLFWNKKVEYAKELKVSFKEEEQKTGSTLKNAIHHMKVRYQELCRAQEKLMQDLERSIDKREKIILAADNSLKKANLHPKTTKLNIQRSQNKLREKNKSLFRETSELEHCCQELEAKLKDMSDQFQKQGQELERLQEKAKVSEDRMQEAAIQKHNNLIEIILRQQKYKVLEAIKNSRYKTLAKTSSQMEIDMQKAEGKCLKIVELSDVLICKYPQLSHPLKLVKASILPNVS